MYNSSEEACFRGPRQFQLSSKIANQDGDDQSISQSSLSEESSPISPNQLRSMSSNQQHDLYSNFYKAYKVLSITNQIIKSLFNYSYLRKLHQLTQYQVIQLDDLQFQIEPIEIKQLTNDSKPQFFCKEKKLQNLNKGGDFVKKLNEQEEFELRGNILRKCKIIAKTFSQSFIKDLLKYMIEISYSPDERIISLNKVDDSSLFIVTKGDVELIFEGKDQKNVMTKRNSFQNYTQYESFGELSFFTGKPRTATAISRGFTRVYKIKRQVFLNVLTFHPDDLEKYQAIREQITFGDYTPLLLKCFSCQSNTHMISHCNYIHFCVDKEKIIKNEKFPFQQSRQKGKFRRKKIFISRYNLTINQKKIYNSNLFKQNQEFTEGDDSEQVSLNNNDIIDEDFQGGQGNDYEQVSFLLSFNLRQKFKRYLEDNQYEYNIQQNLISEQFEKMKIYQFYQPQNNFDQIIKRYIIFRKLFGEKRIQPKFSVYTFSLEVMQKGFKLRRAAQHDWLDQESKQRGEQLNRVLEKLIK